MGALLVQNIPFATKWNEACICLRDAMTFVADFQIGVRPLAFIS
jgi:hypothetical protein